MFFERIFINTSRKLKIEHLRETLQELNNEVSFYECECEWMDSPIEKTKKVKITCTKKIELSDKEQQEKNSQT